MNEPLIDLHSNRARKARLASNIGKTGYALLCSLAVLFVIVAGIWFFVGEIGLMFLFLAASVAVYMFIVWYKYDLKPLPRHKAAISLTDKLSGDVLALLPVGSALVPVVVFHVLREHWHTIFYSNHLLIPVNTMEGCMSTYEQDMTVIWSDAERLAFESQSELIQPAHVIGALLASSGAFRNLLISNKLAATDIADVSAWLGRLLKKIGSERPYFGGLGRDWASGFTPQLDQFGVNISLAIEKHGTSFGWLMASPGVTAVRSAFSQGSSAVAVIGEPGVGKTSHIYALAQSLLAETKDRNLEHRQVISLNASTILSSAKRPGDLEDIVMSLLIEASHAGNIILFLDEAQMFFTDGHGSFDMTQILLPVLQSRSVQMVLAMTPRDYQQLRIANQAFASLLVPITLAETSEADTLRVLEDNALSLEHAHKAVITCQALHEAYRLSGRYVQDEAYPGKALQLLKNSLSYAEPGGLVTAGLVQQAIEQSQGVKVGTAAPAEAAALLSLEDDIHKRMINQVHAVHVVASALRRARAGVSNPGRPIGSFLFLGPTGVGKTELAKSVAATYFKSEQNMIRLDMSEYQQPEDVQRMLSNGSDVNGSLIMSVRKQPFSVVLLDEIEKAHPNILNILLQLLDEGQLTDTDGRIVSFKDCIIIITSNAGANSIREHIDRGEKVEDFRDQLTDELINTGQFKPELLNRFDEVVLFTPLGEQELTQVVALMVQDINKTLGSQNITVELTPSAVMKIVQMGYDARLGARPMRRALQRSVEDGIANRILSGQTHPGDHVVMDINDLAA